MFNTRSKKGSFQASFFIIPLLFISSYLWANTVAIQFPTEQKITEIASTPTWQALIHWDGKTHHINDKNFLLSQKSFSPKQELIATLNYLYTENPDAVCRFPARYVFLQKELHLPTLNLDICDELKEFQNKAPIDQLHLVFASENLSQPSSMMGHVLLKVSGMNAQNIHVEHAISFYTNIDGFNIPKIIYTSMISGKQGYFSLSPYKEKLERYSEIENRNVWEYEIDTNNFTRQLIQYHFFELKQTNLTYFFGDYNCATLTQFVLAITTNKTPESLFFGVTPTDVVKQTKNDGAIKSTSLIAATKWHIRMLEDSVAPKTKKQITASILNNRYEDIAKIENEQNRFIALQLAEDYKNLQKKNNKIDYQQADDLQNIINENRNNTPSFDIDLSDYKDPTKSPADSQLAMGGFRYFDDDYVTVNILPASHKLEDDNSQYFGETELTLGEISIASSLKNGSAFLNRFTLYGVKSLMPRDQFAGGLSGKFSIGMEQQIYNDWKKHGQFYINGGLGSTYALGNDISVYGLLSIGLASSTADTYTVATPELGMIIKEIFKMKSIVHAQRNFTDSAEIPNIDKLTFTQSFYVNSNWAAFLEAEKITIENKSNNQFSFWIKHYF